MPIQTMNKRKDWQAGLGIKSHKPFCQRLSGGLSCPSSGHSVNKRRASSQIGGFAFMHNASWRFCDT